MFHGIFIKDCGLNCHEKCRDLAPKACTKYKSVQRDPTSENLEAGAATHTQTAEYFPYSRGDRQGESTNIIYQVSNERTIRVLFFGFFLLRHLRISAIY